MKMIIVRILQVIIPKKIRNIIWEMIEKVKRKHKYFFKTNQILGKKQKVEIILIMTAEHVNLGDHAIAIAERKFIEDHFSKENIIEISYYHYLYEKRRIKKRVDDNTLFFISGGGYLGNVWKEDDRVVRDIIKTFSDNKIVILPQTIYYSDNSEGKRYLKATKGDYERHENLLFVLREKKSFDFVKKEFFLSGNSRVLLAPDMALYLYNNLSYIYNNSREIGICFRTDREKVLDNSIKGYVQAEIKKNEFRVKEISTILNYEVTIDRREIELKKKFEEILSLRMIVTDCLHAMIFAALLGIPCIVFNNKTGKVFGVYEWIKEIEYIKVVNNCSEFLKAFENLCKANIEKESKNQQVYLQREFEKLYINIKELRENIGKEKS